MDMRIVAGGQFPGDRSVLSDCREAHGSKMFPAKGGGARSVPGREGKFLHVTVIWEISGNLCMENAMLDMLRVVTADGWTKFLFVVRSHCCRLETGGLCRCGGEKI